MSRQTKQTQRGPKSKEIAVKKTENALQTATDFEGFAGHGMENVGGRDLLVPRLTILQALSPQLNKQKSEYIAGAEAGMICDVGTGEVFPDGIVFLPVFYRMDFLEWAPRQSGKGLVQIHSDAAILDRCKRDERNRNNLPNGNYVAETAQMFGLNLSADARMSFIPMTSTQLKKSRRWLTLASGEKLTASDGRKFTAPLFYRMYNLSSASESNNDGSWYGWKVERGIALPDYGDDWHDLLDAAKAFHEQLSSGALRGNVADMQDDSGGASASGDDAM